MTVSPRLTQVLGYASLCLNGAISFLDCELLREFSMKITNQMEILAEEHHPSVRRRPCFNEVRRIIARGTAKVLVVPSLFHIAGGDRARMEKFLNFLEFHDVRLLSLEDNIDSEYSNKAEILAAVTAGALPKKITLKRDSKIVCH